MGRSGGGTALRIEELEAKIEQVLAGVASLQSALEKGGTQGQR